jgi:GntR family transcriptional regulator
LIHIDIRSRTPIFEQIKHQLTELAVSGALAPHEAIPSIRSMAHDLKLNVNTVKRAFTELEQAGVIYTLPGRGSFIAESAIDNAQLKAKALEDLKTALRIARANGVTRETVTETVTSIYESER